MSARDDELAAVETMIAAVCGKAAWGTALGVGCFVTVEFGGQRPTRDPKRRHGEFRLWVYCSAWRIENPREIIASSEDPREQLKTAVKHLDGRTISRITVERPSLSAAFEFADGTMLRTFSIFSKDYEHWIFYLPNGEVFTAGPGSNWSLRR
jgi:hypothetical protein